MHVFADVLSQVLVPLCFRPVAQCGKPGFCRRRDGSPFQNVGGNENSPNRRLPALLVAACDIGGRQPGQYCRRELVAAGKHVGGMIAVAFKGDV